MEPRIIKIKKIIGQGTLAVIDKQNNLPFEIKRLFYVYDIPINTRRGGHAHKILKQFIWTISGSLEIKTISKSGRVDNFILDSPDKGLYIPEMIWADQIIHIKNTIYCVAASDYFDESEYIRNRDEFEKLTED